MSISKDTYVIDYMDDYTDLYYCIPINIWNSMEPAASPEEDDYIRGDEIRFKKLESFLEILKPCGLKDHNIMHINLATTPFICEKYSEENPVPYKSLGEILGIDKWRVRQ